MHLHRRIAAAATLLLAAAAPAAPLSFAVTYDASVTDTYTGRVYVMMSTSRQREPRTGPAWFGTEPFFAVDVTNWRPGTPLVIDDDALGYPGPPSSVEAADWHIQAVMRRNLDSPDPGQGGGTAVSPVLEQHLDGATGGPVALAIAKVLQRRDQPDTDRLKNVRLRSRLLSDFHGRDVYLEAAVLLPHGYDDDPAARCPALYIIPGFGGSQRQAIAMAGHGSEEGDRRIVRIGLNPRCRTGHHVFADSANNGPWGTALVTELIPYLERTYRLAAEPRGRYLTGASSGGWASLWLQITHPDFFNGTWSLVPDPVDFHAFQLVNLYAPGANMYHDHNGARVPLARRGGEVVKWYDDFCAMEVVLGEGGQLYSFDAVFSPRGPDGRPVPFFDRRSGAVDPAVIEAWKKYDIRQVLQQSWSTLGPKLAGKLHIFAGEDDSFYLEDAVKLLGTVLADLGSDAVIEVLPGRTHQTVLDDQLRQRIDGELLQRFDQGG